MIQAFLPPRSHGGVGHFADQLAAHLVRRGHAVTMYSMHPGPVGAPYKIINPAPDSIVTRGKFGLIYGFALWLSGQNFDAYDVIHALGDNQFLRTHVPVVRTLSGAALAEAIHSHRARTKLMFLLLYPLEIAATFRARESVGISADTNRYFPGVHNVIPEGIDLDIFSPGDRTKSSYPSILSVGHRLRDRKRLGLLVDIFENEVRPKLPQAELWLVCDETVTRDGTRSWSDLNTQSLAQLYRQAWIFCLPSTYEGFGRPYAEAMASGTAVVSTSNPGAREVLQDGQCGRIVKVVEIGQTLLDLLTDADARESLQNAGLERAREFAWDRVADSYEALYERAMGPKGPLS